MHKRLLAFLALLFIPFGASSAAFAQTDDDRTAPTAQAQAEDDGGDDSGKLGLVGLLGLAGLAGLARRDRGDHGRTGGR